MAKKRLRPLSDAQLSWLRALAAGNDPTARFTSQSDYGGAIGTVGSLYRRGLLDARGGITPAGRLAAGGFVPAAPPKNARFRRLLQGPDITVHAGLGTRRQMKKGKP